MSDQVLISMITGCVSIISLVLILLLKKDQVEIHKQINGQQQMLIDAVAGKNFAEGKIQGTENAAVVAKDLLQNPVLAANQPGGAAPVVPVQIVGQDHPLDVKQTEKN